MTKDEAAGHRNYLKAYAIPLERLLQRLMRDAKLGEVFSSTEQKQIAKFMRLLDKKAVPSALVKVIEDPPLLFLG